MLRQRTTIAEENPDVVVNIKLLEERRQNRNDKNTFFKHQNRHNDHHHPSLRALFCVLFMAFWVVLFLLIAMDPPTYTKLFEYFQLSYNRLTSEL